MGTTAGGDRSDLAHSMFVPGVNRVRVCTCRIAKCTRIVSDTRGCIGVGQSFLGTSMEHSIFGGSHPLCAGANSSVPAHCTNKSDTIGSLVTSNYMVRNAIGGDVLFQNIAIGGNTAIRGYVVVGGAIIKRSYRLGGMAVSGNTIVDSKMILDNAGGGGMFVSGNGMMWCRNFVYDG